LLAFKAQEIEELADVYFFRPLGMVLARAACALGLTPTAVTIVGMFVGAAGGALLYDERRASAAFGLIILHSILDSSDGQLARMTGRVTELGRVLDGVGGYVTHVAIYVALMARALAGGGSSTIVLLAVAAAVANVIHAQMYDYHRAAYVRSVIEGRVQPERRASQAGDSQSVRLARATSRAYQAIQERLAGAHPDVERAIARRSVNGIARQEDRERYRSCFYWPVRGWNLFGDNTRFYAIGLCAWLQRPEWFFVVVLVPMNMAFVCVWLWQRHADRRFLGGV
jgi:phosphatidylglycerophosphate synthase